MLKKYLSIFLALIIILSIAGVYAQPPPPPPAPPSFGEPSDAVGQQEITPQPTATVPPPPPPPELPEEEERPVAEKESNLMLYTIIGISVLIILIIIWLILRKRQTQPNVQDQIKRVAQYIKDTEAKGFSEEEIKQKVLKAGYTREEIEVAFDMVKKGKI